MINAAQLALGATGGGPGIMAGISSQGRSGFQSNVMTKLDSIESKLSGGGGGGGAMPVEQPPMMPVGNLGGNLAQPDPVLPEIQNAGGGGLAPIGGGIDPIADATVNEPYQMPQSRSFI
jgi:hypothetical protein